MTADQPVPLDGDLIDALRKRDGQRTIVVTADGTRHTVWNIAWGYDMGDEFAHVTTNISPQVEGAPVGFFRTSDVRDVLDDSGARIAG
ncbi:MAG: hypothetical protein JWM98_1795 [Thermoleophilia bacterium]|nr:hypothetical protein [Thermoleophilia bacterium]